MKLNTLLCGTLLLGMAVPAFARTATVPSSDEAAGGKACTSRECSRGFHKHRHARLIEKLNLTADQQKKLDELRVAGKSELRPKAHELFALKRQMRDLITQKDIDVARVKGLEVQLKAKADELADVKLEQRLKFMEVLTPEQRQQLNTFHGERHFEKWST